MNNNNEFHISENNTKQPEQKANTTDINCNTTLFSDHTQPLSESSTSPNIPVKLTDAIFFLISIIMGCLYMRFVFMKGFGGFSSVFGFTVPFMLYCFAYFFLSKKKVSVFSIMSGTLVIILSIPFLLYSNVPSVIVLLIHALAAYTIFLLGQSEVNTIDKYFPAELFFSIAVKPFSCFFKCICSLRGLSGKKINKSKLLYIIAGLCIGFPIFAFTLSLLSASDDGFKQTFQSLINCFDNINLFNQYGFPFPSVLVSLYLFGGLFCAKFSLCNISRNSLDKAAKNIKISPKTLILSAIIPVIFLYIMYFGIQFSYIFGGITGKLPENLTYSGYARQGFFELCALCSFNIMVIFLAEAFARPDKEKTSCPESIKKISCIISVFTILLIISAIAKMVMYISVYGFTPKRIYPTVFLVYLLLFFSFVIIKRVNKRINFPKAVSIAALSMLIPTIYINIPYLCIHGNVTMYENGYLQSLDGVIYRQYAESTVIVLNNHGKLPMALDMMHGMHGYCYQTAHTKPDFRSNLEYIHAQNILENYFEENGLFESK